MNIELTEKELRMVEWTVIAYLERIEREQRTEIENDLWDFLEDKCIICREILKKIKNDKESNQCTNRRRYTHIH